MPTLQQAAGATAKLLCPPKNSPGLTWKSNCYLMSHFPTQCIWHFQCLSPKIAGFLFVNCSDLHQLYLPVVHLTPLFLLSVPVQWPFYRAGMPLGHFLAQKGPNPHSIFNVILYKNSERKMRRKETANSHQSVEHLHELFQK